MGYILNVIITAVSLLLSTYIVPGLHMKDFITAVIVAFVLSILNLIVKPILSLLTLPITLLTLGLFTFVINALILLLAAHFVGGFMIDTFWSAVLGAIVVSFISTILSHLFHKD